MHDPPQHLHEVSNSSSPELLATGAHHRALGEFRGTACR